MRYFTEKIVFGPFSLLREVSKIEKEIMNSSNPKQYIKDNDIEEVLKEVYWTKMYGDIDSANIAFEIIEEIIFSGYRLTDSTTNKDILDMIMSKCKERDREDLYTKIIYTCPNGDSVVHTYLDSLLNR